MYAFKASSRGMRGLRVLADYTFNRDKVVVIAWTNNKVYPIHLDIYGVDKNILRPVTS